MYFQEWMNYPFLHKLNVLWLVTGGQGRDFTVGSVLFPFFRKKRIWSLEYSMQRNCIWFKVSKKDFFASLLALQTHSIQIHISKLGFFCFYFFQYAWWFEGMLWIPSPRAGQETPLVALNCNDWEHSSPFTSSDSHRLEKLSNLDRDARQGLVLQHQGWRWLKICMYLCWVL